MTKKNSRKEVREQIMQLVFQMDAENDFDYENLILSDVNANILSDDKALVLVKEIREHISDIDEIINSNSDKWKVNRMSKVDIAVLRVAVCELMYIDDVPNPVAINEAVELSKHYGEERSYAFVNAVLSKINKGISD